MLVKTSSVELEITRRSLYVRLWRRDWFFVRA